MHSATIISKYLFLSLVDIFNSYVNVFSGFSSNKYLLDHHLFSFTTQRTSLETCHKKVGEGWLDNAQL